MSIDITNLEYVTSCANCHYWTATNGTLGTCDLLGGVSDAKGFCDGFIVREPITKENQNG